MGNNNKGRGTVSKTVSKGQKKNSKVSNDKKSRNVEKNEKESIFQEVTINLKNTEYNQKKSKVKQKRKSYKILKFVLSIIFISILIFAGLFIKRWSENGWTLSGFVATILGHDANTLANLPRVNILVIGQSQNLTDTLMVCSYDPKTQEAAMLSIPRDTFVGRNKNYATGSDKINAIYQIDPDMLVQKVNNITGLDIKYYVKVDTAGLRELVDSVGGIYFDVPMDMDYDDSSQDLYIHLKSGYQLLDGNKAEQVLRFRHNNDGSSYPIEYGDQDLGRMKTQRAFLTEVIKQLAKTENITKVDDYIKIANNNVETNFSLWTLKDYAPYLIDFKVENIQSATLPGTPIKYNELWFYAHNKSETDKIVRELFKTELSEDQEKNNEIKVSILNGTNDDSKMEKLESLLKQNGYTIASTGKATETKKTVIVNRTEQSDSVADELKNLVGVGIVSNSSPSKSGVDFTIIIGEDY